MLFSFAYSPEEVYLLCKENEELVYQVDEMLAKTCPDLPPVEDSSVLQVGSMVAAQFEAEWYRSVMEFGCVDLEMIEPNWNWVES